MSGIVRRGDRLGQRALNRALLARQLLLRRAPSSPLEAVERLVGLQAQSPQAPYVGLWSRLVGFEAEALSALLVERAVVRMALMRTTIHLVSAGDALALRPVLHGVVARSFAASAYAKHLDGLDLDAVGTAGRRLVEGRPRTRAELGPLLGQQWPDRDPDSLAHCATWLTPMVQPPPRALWQRSGPAAWAPLESWLGRPLGTDPSPDGLVLRYLGAFGPATVGDVQTWSGLTRLREVTERLRPRLRTFVDDHGIELVDLPDAPRPDPGEPAPVRFLPEYDNLLLAHADRRRVIAQDHRARVFTKGAVLLDGRAAATWRIVRARGSVTLVVDAFVPLTKRDRHDVEDEGARLLAFVEPGGGGHGGHDVRVVEGR